MNHLLTEIASYLQGSNIGTIGLNIFQYTLPTSPIDCLAIIPTGGTLPNNALSLPSYQILVRGSSNSSAESKASDVYVALNRKWCVLATVKGWHQANHPVGPHYQDDLDYPIFTLNFQFYGIGPNLGL